MSHPVTWVLGIESSCDEMAAAVVREGREIASSCVHGQDEVHRPYGGVVPELASRDHVRAVHQVVERALAEAGISAEQLDVHLAAASVTIPADALAACDRLAREILYPMG